MLLTEQLSAPWATALGWTVLHSLWQAAALAILLAMILRLSPKLSAIWRYRLAYSMLLTVFALAAFNFYQLYDPGHDLVTPTGWKTEGTFPVEFVGSTRWEGVQDWIVAYLDNHLSAIVGFWFVGFAFFGIRLFGGLTYIHRLRYRGIEPLDPVSDVDRP